jgi:hypothetical protein
MGLVTLRLEVIYDVQLEECNSSFSLIEKLRQQHKDAASLCFSECGSLLTVRSNFIIMYDI